MIARIVLALDRTSQQKQIYNKLSQLDVIVDVLKGKHRLWERLHREVCDLVVVSRSRIPEPAAAIITALSNVPDAPLIVILAETDDAEDRAYLLAAGCQSVLHASTSVESLLQVLETLIARRRELARHKLSAKGLLARPRLIDFVSQSPVMKAFMSVVQRVVQSNVSLLILGETGVGKERLARAIHNDGPRSTGPFMAINCAALPEHLLESELFGHEEGAFTGATRSHRGCFELAHGGTVFLDEIGDLPLHLQVKLLHVLQEHEIRRIGGERSFTVDVRIMAATNRKLEEDLAKGAFRRDLYYRLSVMMLTLPPLQERIEDIPELVRSYLSYLRPRIGREVYQIEERALQALMRYQWPGNVRELINVIERAMLLCQGDTITLGDLPLSISNDGTAAMTLSRLTEEGSWETNQHEWIARPWNQVRQEVLDRAECAYLTGLLRQHQGRIGVAAREAGLQPRSLYEKMKRHGLRKEDFKAPAP